HVEDRLDEILQIVAAHEHRCLLAQARGAGLLPCDGLGGDFGHRVSPLGRAHMSSTDWAGAMPGAGAEVKPGLVVSRINSQPGAVSGRTKVTSGPQLKTAKTASSPGSPPSAAMRNSTQRQRKAG